MNKKNKFILFGEVFNENMKDPEFQKLYEADREEFELLQELINARKSAKLTQIQLAEKMGTSQSHIARIETGRSTITSLRKYAKATGRKVKITLV